MRARNRRGLVPLIVVAAMVYCAAMVGCFFGSMM
jgi:hypothetical protein